MSLSLSPYGVEAHIMIFRYKSSIFADLHWCYSPHRNSGLMWHYLQLVEDPTPPWPSSSRTSYIVYEGGRCIPLPGQHIMESNNAGMFPGDEHLTPTVEACWESVLIRDRPIPCLLPGEFREKDLCQSILRVPSQFPLNTPFRFDDHSAQQFVHACKAQVVQVDHTHFLESSRINSQWTSATDTKHMVQADNTILNHVLAIFPSWMDAFDADVIQVDNTCSLESSGRHSYWTTTYTFTTPQHRFTIRVGQCCQDTSLAIIGEGPGTGPIAIAPLWATFHAGTTTEVNWIGDYSQTKELLKSLPKDGQHCCETDHVLHWPQLYMPNDQYDQEIFWRKFHATRSGTVSLYFTHCPINPGQTLILKASCSGLVCCFLFNFTMPYIMLILLGQNWNRVNPSISLGTLDRPSPQMIRIFLPDRQKHATIYAWIKRTDERHLMVSATDNSLSFGLLRLQGFKEWINMIVQKEVEKREEMESEGEEELETKDEDWETEDEDRHLASYNRCGNGRGYGALTRDFELGVDMTELDWDAEDVEWLGERARCVGRTDGLMLLRRGADHDE